ncbi:hypothetical protein ACF07T_14910 [Streptomyces sp. NPDC015184]|uniref:hypothetical protein n=1 Tax=Streptomyces sp. NPDC015184 TaxID=3364946 RepID=UPI0036F7A436
MRTPSNPGRGGARADIAIGSSEDGAPRLLEGHRGRIVRRGVRRRAIASYDAYEGPVGVPIAMVANLGSAAQMTSSLRHSGFLRRMLCRLGLHKERCLTPDELDRPATRCLHEWRCAFCDRLRRSDVLHRYGREKPTDEPCRRTVACVRCGHEYGHVLHANDLVPVDSLPAEQRPDYVTYYRRATPCDYAQICRRCGETDNHVVTEHDWEDPWWGERCRRCGGKWFDDGD